MTERVIKHEDIQAGDTIRVEWVYADGAYTHTVTVDHRGENGEWMTKRNFGTCTMSEGATVYLVHRPMKPLPTEEGSIILVTGMSGEACHPHYVALQYFGQWLCIPSAISLYPSDITDWKEAKLVTVEDETE